MKMADSSTNEKRQPGSLHPAGSAGRNYDVFFAGEDGLEIGSVFASDIESAKMIAALMFPHPQTVELQDVPDYSPAQERSDGKQE